jgi:zinc transport system substrate-binding protein
MAETLSEADPGNAAIYQANAKRLAARITALDRALAAELAPIRDVPYVVFHDAYHYFEKHYGLSAAGSITISPEQPPGARRLSEIRDKIARLQVRCVFAEPQFEPTLVETVREGTAARTGVLDPLGAALPSGPDLYFEVMRGLARSLRGCLAEG